MRTARWIVALVVTASIGCSVQAAMGGVPVNDDAVMGNAEVILNNGSSTKAASEDVASQLKNLWNMEDARKVPFDVEVVCTESRDGYRLDGFYLTSEMTPEGPNRIYCTLARPEKVEKPVPLWINLTGGGDDVGFVLHLAKYYNCAALDIEWRNQTTALKSKWAHRAIAGMWTVTPRLADSFSHAFIVGISRAIDYVTGLPGIDKTRIACGGGSMGGWYSLLAAGVDSRVTCVFDKHAAGGLGKSRSQIGKQLFDHPVEQQKVWKAAYDPISYAPCTKAATLMYLGSNDFFFWLGDGIRHYDALAGEKRLIIAPNYNHNFRSFGDVVPECDSQWVAHCLHGEPEFPAVTDPVGRKLAYTWKSSGPYRVTRSILYWSPGKPQWPARYWMAIEATGDGGKWTASIPEEYAGLSGQVYVTIFDEKDRAVSSRLVSRRGLDPQKTAGPLWSGGAFWDVASGPRAWRNPGAVVRSAIYTFRVESASPAGLRVYPNEKEGRFAMVTNSAILASAQSSDFKGIRLVVNGCGYAGKMVAALQRDSGCPYEIIYGREIEYNGTATVIDIPWSEFKGPDGSDPTPVPFDGFRLDGKRAGDQPFVIEKVELYR